MEAQILRDRSLPYIQGLANESAWTLTSEDLSALTDAILPFLSDASSPQDIRTVAHNYYLDGPLVLQMQTPSATQGELRWLEWRTYMLKLAYKKGLSAEEAEDLVQTLYLHTHRSLASFKFNSRATTYFHSIFNNQYLKWLQTKKKDVVSSLDNANEYEIEFLDNNATSDAETIELRQLISQEIQRLLNDIDFKILFLFYVEKSTMDPQSGKTHKWTDAAIGELLNMPLNTVTSRRTRALQRLQQNARLRIWFNDLL